MSWVSLILVGAIVSAFRNILSRKVGTFKADVSAYALFASFVAVWCFGLVYGLIHSDAIDVSRALSYFWFLVLGGLLFSSANYITLKMFRAASASVIVLLSLLNIVGVVVISALFANESLTLLQWAGAGLLVSS